MGGVPAIDNEQAQSASELLLSDTRLTEDERETVINCALALSVIELKEPQPDDVEDGSEGDDR